METELLMLFFAHLVGIAIFGKFQSQTPWWRHILKWSIILLIGYLLNIKFGQTVTLVTFAIVFLLGIIGHVLWCRKHNIHPFNATPRKKYYQLRGWAWEE
jgi:hypothetical protein